MDFLDSMKILSVRFDIPRNIFVLKNSVFSYLWFPNIKLKNNIPWAYLIIIGERDYCKMTNTTT